MKRLIVKGLGVLLLSVLVLPVFANGVPTPNKAAQTYKIPPPQIIKQAVFYSGSLKSNVERVAAQYGWKKVEWNSPNDYEWVTYTKINKNTLQDVLRTVLEGYPLQAVFYKGNHVLEIKPRTLR